MNMQARGNILLVVVLAIALLLGGGYFLLKDNLIINETYQNISKKIEESKEQIRTTDEDIDKQLVNLDADSKLIEDSLNDQAIDVFSE